MPEDLRTALNSGLVFAPVDWVTAVVERLIDLGGGTGAAAWTVAAPFSSARAITVADQAVDALALGRGLASHASSAALGAASWIRDEGFRTALPHADLVTVSYVLGELPAAFSYVAALAAGAPVPEAARVLRRPAQRKGSGVPAAVPVGWKRGGADCDEAARSGRVSGRAEGGVGRAGGSDAACAWLLAEAS